MIRNATFSDIPRLMELLAETHRQSKYNGRCGLSEKAMGQLFMALVAGQNKKDVDATYLVVADQDGEVVGFMAGTLGRIYNVCDKLMATDLFLIHQGKYPINVMKMVDGYVKWAEQNPKVIEIGLSWSDATRTGYNLASLYKHKGFKLVGEQYELRTDMDMEEAA